MVHKQKLPQDWEGYRQLILEMWLVQILMCYLIYDWLIVVINYLIYIDKKVGLYCSKINTVEAAAVNSPRMP